MKAVDNSHNWRRTFAFIGVWGGCVTSFIYICVVTWMLQADAQALFWLAMCANAHLFVGMLALGWFGGRRMSLSATRDGLTIDDRHDGYPTLGQVAGKMRGEE